MNSVSNIEIVNFDEIYQEGQIIDLEKDLGLNYINNIIIEEYYTDTDYYESQSEYNDFESRYNTTYYNEVNSNLSINKKSLNDSFDNSNFGELNSSLEMIRSSDLNNSFNQIEKISNNSFSFIRSSPKYSLNSENDLNFSNLSLNRSTHKIFTCAFEGCKKIYKSKENLTLHYRNIHLKEKPYSCKFCSSRFSHRNGKDSYLSYQNIIINNYVYL